MGESCELDGRSYASCNFSYEARLDPMTGKKISVPSLSVGFAFGTHFWNTDVEGIPVHPPQVSSVNRHQIFIWVFDPQSKIPIQGFVLVFSTMVSDIRRKGQIEWDASLKIDIESGIASELEGGRKPHEDTSFFVGIVPMPQSGDKDKSPRLNPPPPVTLTPQPITSIGWDSKYAQWRDPVYPKLDKKFRPLEQGDASLVAYAIGSFPKEKEED
ncbi:hypothetical protein DFH07DRAFT_482767 [Mycena maculata]|uniref:Uncharacterized protein n=1 Tax=Mycena maculata TaxID=230809 RepID=A0AAD7J4M8_9AGAR|nr:hypothetical protein DFH07DRAFT_482767 [Mycena maculata]